MALPDIDTYIKKNNIDRHDYYFNNHYDSSYPPSKKRKSNPVEYITDAEFDEIFDINNSQELAMIERALSYVPPPANDTKTRIWIGDRK